MTEGHKAIEAILSARDNVAEARQQLELAGDALLRITAPRDYPLEWDVLLQELKNVREYLSRLRKRLEVAEKNAVIIFGQDSK